MNVKSVYLGADVAKAEIVVAGVGLAQPLTIANAPAGYRALLARLGDGPVPGIAAQHIPALAAQVQVGRALVGLAQVAPARRCAADLLEERRPIRF